jgi:hypothetical protein
VPLGLRGKKNEDQHFHLFHRLSQYGLQLARHCFSEIRQVDLVVKPVLLQAVFPHKSIHLFQRFGLFVEWANVKHLHGFAFGHFIQRYFRCQPDLFFRDHRLHCSFNVLAGNKVGQTYQQPVFPIRFSVFFSEPRPWKTRHIFYGRTTITLPALPR